MWTPFSRIDLRIKQKMILSYLFLLLLIVGFIFSYFPAEQRTQLERELQNKLQDMTEMLAIGVGVSLSTGETAIFGATVDWVKNDADVAHVVVLDEDGAVLVEEAFGDNHTRLSVATVLEDSVVTELGGVSYFAVPILYEGAPQGRAILGLSRAHLESELQENQSASVAAGLVLLLVGTAVVWVLSGLIASPIVEMTDVATRLAAGNTGVPVPVGAGGEVGGLARAFGTMQTNLRLISTQAQQIAQGNLSHRVDEGGDLADAFNQMVDDLSQLVRQVQDASLQMDLFASKILKAIMEQSSSATQQSASISTTADTMAELARTSERITESSNRVFETAQGTQSDAQSGVKALQDTISHMAEIRDAGDRSIGEIRQQSQKVRQISGVMDIIDSIADQTKLIAFNAAIEAAGAGEKGKRFGVVAQEVRRLADTVVEATEDIRSQIVEMQEATTLLVETSQENTQSVERGMGSAHDTENSLQQIVRSASTTTDAVDQISRALSGQKDFADQVMYSLNEAAGGAEQFARTVDETNQVAAEMSGFSRTLNSLIGRFRVHADDDADAGRGGGRKAQ
jgi:methyl-accepting chemotaxis protein